MKIWKNYEGVAYWFIMNAKLGPGDNFKELL